MSAASPSLPLALTLKLTSHTNSAPSPTRTSPPRRSTTASSPYVHLSFTFPLTCRCTDIKFASTQWIWVRKGGQELKSEDDAQVEKAVEEGSEVCTFLSPSDDLDLSKSTSTDCLLCISSGFNQSQPLRIDVWRLQCVPRFLLSLNSRRLT